MRLVTVEIKVARELVIYKLNASDNESSDSIKSRALRKMAKRFGEAGGQMIMFNKGVEITDDVPVDIG